MKKIKDRIPQQVDAALERHAVAAESWATRVRLWLALIFAVAAAWSWGQATNAKFIYLALAAAWLLFALAIRARVRRGASDPLARVTTFVDLTIVHLGLVAFATQGLFFEGGSRLFLAYFPLLGVAAMRYRALLVVQAGLYAGIIYAVVSLLAGGPPWYWLAMLAPTVLVAAFNSRKPKRLVADVATAALQEAYDLGARQKEAEMTSLFHQAFLPPPIVKLPGIWSSSKHGTGSQTAGDYYHLFETPRGPLVAVGDLSGHGIEAVLAVARIHQRLAQIVQREESLPAILAELNQGLWEQGQGRRPLSCVLARWEGDHLHYVNAGHLPLIRMSKGGLTRLPVTAGAVGAAPEAAFAEATVEFPARDLLLLYTDGLYARLTSDREQGIAEIESLAEKFSGGEINTLCHRVFDCSQVGMEGPPDDCTLVVVRRQPAAGAEAKAQTGVTG